MSSSSKNSVTPEAGVTLARQMKRFFDFLWGKARDSRKDLLLDLATLEDGQCHIFWKKWGRYFDKESDQALLKWRDELRRVWELDSKAGDILNGWLSYTPRGFASLLPRRRWIVLPRVGLLPNPKNLPLMLALSVAELGSKLALCSNPECPDRYFIRSKPKQRFCFIRECAAVGQREHKLHWWREHGKQRRKKSKKLRRTNARKRRR